MTRIESSQGRAQGHGNSSSESQERSIGSDPRRVRLSITYMHCKGCAATIKGSLKREPGVLEATVDYAKREGTVLYDPSKTNPKGIVSNPIFKEPSPFEVEVLEDQEA